MNCSTLQYVVLGDVGMCGKRLQEADPADHQRSIQYATAESIGEELVEEILEALSDLKVVPFMPRLNSSY